MFEHLTESEIENFGRQKLSAAELLMATDHLGVCSPCRREVEKTLGGEAAFFRLRTEIFGSDSEMLPSATLSTHPPFEEIAEYVDGISAGEERQLVKDHLVSCEQCALAVDDLHAFRDHVAPKLNRDYHPESVKSTSESLGHRWLSFLPVSWQRSPLAFGSALAVLLLMVTGWLVWQAQQKKETITDVVLTTPTPSLTPPATPAESPTASPTPALEVITQLNDGEGRLMLDRQGNLSGVEYLPPAYQRLVTESLMKQRLEKSSLLAGLTRPVSSLMGGDELGNRFSVTEPIGKVMWSDRPTFRWSRLGGAKGYVVEVYDEKFNLVAASPQLSDDSWTSSQPLKRGGIYSWQVKAIKEGQEVTSPRPPAPQAKFRILDEARMNELAQAQRAYPSSHLTLGLLYAQAGLLDKAEQEFRALQRANPDSALVRQLLSQIRKLRS